MASHSEKEKLRDIPLCDGFEWRQNCEGNILEYWCANNFYWYFGILFTSIWAVVLLILYIIFSLTIPAFNPVPFSALLVGPLIGIIFIVIGFCQKNVCVWFEFKRDSLVIGYRRKTRNPSEKTGELLAESGVNIGKHWEFSRDMHKSSVQCMLISKLGPLPLDAGGMASNKYSAKIRSALCFSDGSGTHEALVSMGMCRMDVLSQYREMFVRLMNAED